MEEYEVFIATQNLLNENYLVDDMSHIRTSSPLKHNRNSSMNQYNARSAPHSMSQMENPIVQRFMMQPSFKAGDVKGMDAHRREMFN